MAPKRASQRPPRVGETVAARDFYAGAYAKVVAATVDAPPMELADVDVAFAVGALTFVGRVPDAQTLFDGYRLARGLHDERTLAASRFFLGVAYARAGEFARAARFLVEGVRSRLRAGDPWSRSFGFQGLAAHRYFTGRHRAAAQHALRAQRAAQVAQFAYVQMLATDLRGHALVQLGRYQAGRALLEQAQGFAERLGFGMNAYAIACSMAIYKAKLKISPDAIAELEALLARRAHDSYSKRMLLAQAAIQYALRGRAESARRALGSADEDALRVEGRRAKVASLLARLYVARFSAGRAACAEVLAQAHELLDANDLTFQADLRPFERYVARTPAPPIERTPFAEDEVSPLLDAGLRGDAHVVVRLLATGALGLIPEVLGLEPGRRVLLLARDDTLVVEDHGDLWARRSPPRWATTLLRALARGATKEQIVAALWGLRRYSPERHDPLVRTTIHRLRALIEPRGEWVAATPDGYALSAELVLHGAAEPLAGGERWAEADDLEVEAGAVPPAFGGRAATLEERALELVARDGSTSVPEAARALDVSASTALRALRRLVAQRKLRKTGAARSTRYRPRR